MSIPTSPSHAAGGDQPSEGTPQPPFPPSAPQATPDATAGPNGSRLSRLRPHRPDAARVARHRDLLTGSGVLVVGAGVQALSGMLFSLIAANGDAKSNFGNASALFTSVLFVTYLAGLGLPVSLARYSADRSDDSHVVFSWGLLATVVSAIAATGLYLGAVDPKAADVLWSWSSIGGPVLFMVIVLGSAFSLVFDVRCMTMRRWNLVLVRIVIVGIAKVALIPLSPDSHRRALLLFVYLAAPVAVSGFVGVALLPRITGGRHRLRPIPPSARAAIRYSLVNYLSTLAYQAPYFALPVIVLINVDAATNSSFYVAWGIVAIAFYVPSAIGQALLAEGGKDGAQLRSQVRLAVLLAVALMGAGTVTTFLGKSVVTAAYGHAYHDAARILPAMMLAGIPWAVTSLYLTEVRVMHRHSATVVITLTLTLAIIVPALILVPGRGTNHGLNAASRSWLAGNIFAAIVATIATWSGRKRAREREAVLDPVSPRSQAGEPITA
jgi:O-antigen/teichoic acid export membrane protein